MSARLRRFGPTLALVALTLLAYANSFHAAISFDSRAIILNDPRVHHVSVENVRQIFSEHYWWPTATSNLYRPLTTLSFWFNYAVLGNASDPIGYHVINFLIHVANVLLLWRVATRLVAVPAIPWLAAALFAVHPLGVESVTNLVGRADLLATAAVLAATLAWLRAEEAPPRRRGIAWQIVAGFIAVLGVLAKENAVMVVAALGLLAVRRHGWRDGVRVFLRRALPALLPAIVVLFGARFWLLSHIPPLVDDCLPLVGAAWWPGFMTAIGVLGRYFVLLVWPATLSCDYSYPHITLFGAETRGDAIAWVSLAGLGLLALVLWRRRRAWPNVSFGFLWGAVMLLPTSNLVIRIGAIMAERFLYLPMTGFALAGAAVLIAVADRLARHRSGPWMRGALAGACVLALALRTLARNADWRDRRTLWEAAARATPRSFNVHKGLATSCLDDPVAEADIDEAIGHLERARRLLDRPPLPLEHEDNTVWPLLGKCYRVKGEFCAQRGESAAAAAWFERARATLERSIAVIRWEAAQVKRRYAQRGDTAAAARHYGNPSVYEQLALAQLQLGRLAEAEATSLERRRIDPSDSNVNVMLGAIAKERGALDQAATRLIHAVLLSNSNEIAWRQLADVYARLGVNPSPVTPRPGGGHIEASSPLVRRHLHAALVGVVDSFSEAAMLAEAQTWRERAVREFGCPPELFQR